MEENEKIYAFCWYKIGYIHWAEKVCLCIQMNMPWEGLMRLEGPDKYARNQGSRMF